MVHTAINLGVTKIITRTVTVIYSGADPGMFEGGGSPWEAK